MVLDINVTALAQPLEQAVLDDERLAREAISRKEMYAHLLTLAVQPDTFIPPAHREPVISFLLNKWYSYGALQGAIDDELVTDIHVIGPTTILKRSSENRESTEYHFDSDKAVEEFVHRKLEGTQYSYSLADPICDAILSDGYRMNVIGGPSTRYTVQDKNGRIITEPRTIVSIRKPILPFTLDELVELGMFDRMTRRYLKAIQELGESFIIAGGVGSAKTTLMNALTGDNPRGLINIIIEELPEMTPLADWCLRLTDRHANNERAGEITMERNIINSLRMDGDNEYIGETRDARIAYLFLRMSLIVKRQTGTTFHSNVGLRDAVEGVLTRFILEATEGAATQGAQASYLSTASMMNNKIRHIVTLKDVKGKKRLTEIAEIVGFDWEHRALLLHKVVNYDFKAQRWTFHGMSRDMAERADIEGITIDDVKVSENDSPTLFRIYT